MNPPPTSLPTTSLWVIPMHQPQACYTLRGILSQLFHSPLSLSARGSIVLHFLPQGWCHLDIWESCNFSWQSWFQLVLHPVFLMMYSAYKLNKQGDNIQPWCTRFLIWNQFVVPCPILTVASWPTYRFLKRQVRWSGIPISFRIFHSLLWSTQSKALAQSIKQK